MLIPAVMPDTYLYSALSFLELFPVCLARLAKDPGVDQVSHHGPETCRGLGYLHVGRPPTRVIHVCTLYNCTYQPYSNNGNMQCGLDATASKNLAALALH